MSSNLIYIFYGLIFITVILLVEGVYFLLSTTKSNDRAANKRMKLIQQIGDEHIGISLLRDKRKGSGGSSIIDKISQILWAANSKLTVSGFFMVCAGVALVLFLFMRLLSPAGFIAPLIFSLIFGFALPYVFFRFRAGRRQKLFSEQLCPAIDLVSRGLQAGHPAAVALEMVSKEMADPIGTEFGLAIDEINYGQDRNVALGNIYDRFPNSDLRFFVSALEVQRETGGNLVEVLNNLSNIIRTRRAMKKKVHALSAEGRVTCLIVGLLPFAIMLIISALNPLYYTEYAADPIFIYGMIAPAILYILGMFWIWKMVNIRI